MQKQRKRNEWLEGALDILGFVRAYVVFFGSLYLLAKLGIPVTAFATY